MPAINDFDSRRAGNGAYNMRTPQNKKFDNSVWREGENWLAAAEFPGWLDPQGYVMHIYLWQWLKHLPGASEPYF